MLNHLENHFNQTTTTNGDKAFASTKSFLLDLFSSGGAMRHSGDKEIQTLVSKSFAENPIMTMKALFYLRDVRGGQGERKFFRVGLNHLANHHAESVKKNIHLIPEFGRYDDLLTLLDTQLSTDVLVFIKSELNKDLESENPSLLAKWLPSENASAFNTKRYASKIRKALGMTPREYRKTLTALRKKIAILETKLTEKNYEDIDYSKLPSQAGMKYRQAFFRNDLARYTTFLDSLSKGEVKVNASVLYPSDIVGKILGSWSTSAQDAKLFEGQWNNLPDFIGEKTENSLVMADVSGSMSGAPMNVAISLAMYIAERNKGAYKDHFMTFSGRPQLVKIVGGNIIEKVRNISRAHWQMDTNLESALLTILDVAVKNDLPNGDVVKKLYIISDMQFNRCVDNASSRVLDSVKAKFNRHGYDFPEIVFWNVRDHGNKPATMNEVGIKLVSGYSPSIMTSLLNNDGKTPYDFMLEVIDSERYKEVTA